MQNSCSIILFCPGQCEQLWICEKEREEADGMMRSLSSLIDNQNLLESDRELARLLKYTCLTFLILTHYFLYCLILFCAILNILFKIFSKVQKVE